MLQLEKHSVELVEKLNNVARGNGEYREVDVSTLTHEDITYIIKFVRKHSQTLQEKGIDTRQYSVVTLLAGSTNSDNAIQSFKVGNWRIYAQLTLEQSTEYDENMKKIKDELNRKAYLEMVGSSLFPQDEQKRKRKSVYKETKDELQVITSVLFSMVAVATAIWWAGGTMNPTYKTLLAMFGAIAIAIVETALNISYSSTVTMSFNAMFGGGAECSTNSFNPLNNVLKNADVDRSVMKERPGLGTSSLSAFPKSSTSLREGDRLQHFGNSSPVAHHTGPFGMEAMRTEVGRLAPAASSSSSAWAHEFSGNQHHDIQRDLLERSFNQQHRNLSKSNWNEEYSQQQRVVSPGTSASPASLSHAASPSSSMYMQSPYMPISPSFAGTTQQTAPVNEAEENAKWDEQFDKMNEEISKKAAAVSEQSTATKEEDIQEQFKQTLRDEGLDVDNNQDYLAEFENVWNTQYAPHEDASNKNLASWEKQFNMEMNNARESIENDLIENQATSNPNQSVQTYQFETTNQYMESADPFAEGQRLLKEGGPLSEPALAFEAAARQSPHNAKAWLWLGYTHAMDEKEEAAIKALERCLNEDANELEAMIPLAISYTNEGDDNAATLTLEKWITRKYPSTLTPDTGTSTASNWPWATHQRVIDSFLNIARTQFSSTDKLDPDVQVGLGVLSYATSNYDQAQDCFKTALSMRPDDWLLWNRLGATLANGGNSESAIEAYTKALELRPTFTRAIHNLGVSCLNIGCYKEAVDHLLSAIALQQASNDRSINESQSLWQTLRRSLFAMDRHDLAAIAQPGTPVHKFKDHGFDI
ncbi:TPR-like protein [Wallemia mellicola]|nr:TPR-like protein [Wallemia mellicola]TIC41939.1 TPR-like protein [Wallemia mellicola]TIC55162.1 TPR-like protein [Wallemia mellicola]